MWRKPRALIERARNQALNGWIPLGEEGNTNLDGKFNLCSDGASLRVVPVLKIRTVFDLPLHDLR